MTISLQLLTASPPMDTKVLLPGCTSNANGQRRSEILCGICWQHIRQFHDFQQNILKTQAQLEAQWNRIKVDVRSMTDIVQAPDTTEQKENNDNLDIEFHSLRLEGSQDSSSNRASSAVELETSSIVTEKEECQKPITNCSVKGSSSSTRRHPPSVRYNSMQKTRELDVFIAGLRPQLECDLCNQQLPDFDSLRAHFSRVHQERCYLKCCERKFFRRCVYVEHLRLHLNPDLYKCDICGRSSTSKHNLLLHKQVVHSSSKKLHECEICQRRFNQKPTLMRHMATHATGNKDNICPKCGKGYVLDIQLKTHLKTVHSVDSVCDQCGKTVHGGVGALRQHLREHAGFQKPKWPCDICGSELISRNSLNRHKLSFHHDGSTAYVCRECGKMAASANALLLHKKNVHEAERKFKCPLCEKAFKKNKVLQEHIATHTGQDLYQCPHCPQTFKVSANLHHHRKRTHPVQWAEARQHRLQIPKINPNTITKEIVL